MPDLLRTHQAVLRDGDLVLRPFTEQDWPAVLPWLSDERVLWFSEGDDVKTRSLEEIQAIYRGVSQVADLFIFELGGAPVGDGWVQVMSSERIRQRFPDQRTARIDLRLAHDAWGRGVGTRALRLLTQHAFEIGFDLVFGLDIADHDERSRRTFLRCGYVPWRRVKTLEAPKTELVYDLICRPEHFFGRAAVTDHPGADQIRAGDRPAGATIVVYRREPDLQVLLLHRAHAGPDYEGEWAWTPPAGARFPAEPIDECASRELHEEAGIEARPRLVDETESGWAIYVLEMPHDAEIELDEEHDRYEWLGPAEAQRRCLPAVVAESIGSAVKSIEPERPAV